MCVERMAYALTKQIIISKTVLFIAIIAFVIVFQIIFSHENILIGVTSITAMLMYLQRDLTVSIGKNTLKFIIINLIIGIGAFLTSLNLWLAIPVNFIVAFFVGYTFLDNLRNPIYLPFALEYVFLVATPIPVRDFPLRLAALIVGAICIMLLQLLFNKNRFKKTADTTLMTTCTLLSEQISDLKAHQDLTEHRASFDKLLHSFRVSVYERRADEFSFTNEAVVKLNISVALEKFSLLLSNSDLSTPATLLDDLQTCLNTTLTILKEHQKFSELESVYTKIINHYTLETVPTVEVLEVLNNISFLHDSLHELINLDETHYNLVTRFEEVPMSYTQNILTGFKMHASSMRISYALRLATGITISFFLTNYFHLVEGRWLAFTCVAIIIPIYELSKTKAKDRIFATFVGAAISFVLFDFTPPAFAPLLLMLTGYISSYFTKYRYTTIFVTISAIGAAALSNTSHTPEITLQRIFFVLTGTIMALLINRFIFPYKAIDAVEELKSMYKNTIKNMLQSIYSIAQGKKSDYIMKKLLVTSSLIEDRIRLDNQALENPEDVSILDDGRLLISDLYELYLWLSKNPLKNKNSHLVLEQMKYLLNLTSSNFDTITKGIDNALLHITNTNDKIALIILKHILSEEHELLTQD